MTKSAVRNYCVECDWSMGTDDGLSRDELVDAVLEHFNETGHRIDSEPSPGDSSSTDPPIDRLYSRRRDRALP